MLKSKNKKIKSLISFVTVFLIATVFVGCGSSGSGEGGGGGFVDLSLGCGPVLTQDFKQVSKSAPTKMDILFLTDTSGSSQVQPSVGYLIDHLSKFFDELTVLAEEPKVGVSLAHGASIHSGNLYNSLAAGEPDVIVPSGVDFSTFLTNKLVDSDGSKSDDESIVTESDTSTSYYGTDGGEAGLYSLNKMFTTNYASVSGSGDFLRSDAGLLVFFISDENDICVPGSPAVKDWSSPISLFDFPSGTTTEKTPEEWAKDRYCSGITPDSVLSSLVAKKGSLPVTVSGLVHNDPSNILSGPAYLENGLGHGYLEMISRTNGSSINYNSSSSEIESKLKILGKHVNAKLTLETQFKLIDSGTGLDTDVAPKSINVYVDDVFVGSSFDSDTNRVQLMGQDAGIGGSDIRVEYRATCK